MGLLCSRHWQRIGHTKRTRTHRLVGKTNMYTDNQYANLRFLREHTPKPGLGFGGRGWRGGEVDEGMMMEGEKGLATLS